MNGSDWPLALLIFTASVAVPVLKLLGLTLLLLSPAHAVSDPSELLPNRPQELRAEAIGEQLRCLVCQNESVEQSDADLARDLRGSSQFAVG